MTRTKISELTASAGVTATDLFLTVVSGAGGFSSRKTTGTQLSQFITSSITSLNLTNLSASALNGNGSAITNLTASNISNFTGDVRGQFSAGTGITISNGQISSAGGVSSYSASIGDGNTTTFALTHSLGKTNIIVSVRENPTGAYVYPDITYVSSNITTIAFASAPTSSQYFVSILGF